MMPIAEFLPALRPPAAGVARNPLVGLTPSDMQPVPVGVSIASIAPRSENLVICRLNGEMLSRLTTSQRVHYARLLKQGRTADAQAYFARAARRALNWKRTLTRPGDVIEWIEQPGDKNTFRSVVQIAATIAIAWATQGMSVWVQVGAQIAASIAINALLPPVLPGQNLGQQPGNVFSSSLSGNLVKIDQPIWKVCGRRKMTPPFACDAYVEFVDDDGDDLDNIQYFKAVYAVGIGNHTLEAELLNGTPITHYSDVLVHQYLPPGTQPSQTLKNVTTSRAVSNQVLDSPIDGIPQYVGGFVASEPFRTSAEIGIDIAATRGLNRTVSWQVEQRTINDFGTPLSGWSVIATGSKTASTNTPQRWTQTITIGTPARLEIRVARTDTKDTAADALHEIAWIGLRSYNAEPVTLNADTAHYEVVLRASEQLSSLSQPELALILTGHARTWSPTTGWGTEVATRTPGWWLLELASSAVWGWGLADANIDLQAFYDFAVRNEARQDRFDFTFDTAMDVWQALQLIARAGRGRVFRRNGGTILTIARDEWVPLPVSAFTPRNASGMTISEALPTREMPDGIVIEYDDYRTWLPTMVDCPCPGVTTMVNPIHKRIDGITGPTHIKREGLYEAANLLYRQRKATCKVEMEGELPAFMSTMRWLPEIQGYAASGDVAFWDSDTLTMGLSEPVDWSSTAQYLTLIKDDGSLTTPVRVLPGATAYDIVLPAAPDFTLNVTSGTQERPKYILGDPTTGDELVKVSAIKDGGKGDGGERYIDIEAVPDDERVHTADNAYLPSPGEIQDPIETGLDEEDTPSAILLVRLSDHYISSGAGFVGAGPDISGEATFTLTNDGHAQGYRLHTTDGGAGDSGTDTYANEWMQYGTITSTVAAGYEVRATLLSGTTPTSGDSLGSWLALDTTRSWTMTGAQDFDISFTTLAQLRIEIRDVATETVQSSHTVWIGVVHRSAGDAP